MKHTFAISSNFLNSPFTSVTFPLLSNSVHRNRSSFEALAANLRPMLNIPSVPSSIRPGPAFRTLQSAALFRRRSKSRLSSGLREVEAGRTNLIGCEEREVASILGLDGDVTDGVWSSLRAHCDLTGRNQVEDLRGDPVAKVSDLEARGLEAAHADKPLARPD